VQAIVCSNHGGRQVDGAVGSLDALPGVVEAAGRPAGAVRQRHPHRRRRLQGARPRRAAVLLGRPWVHGLALGGEQGVHHVLRCFLADLDLQAGPRRARVGRRAVAGVPRPAPVTRKPGGRARV
jgi:isopentenyl diphosphate isomerase/L-lactate dehydrogenase-like FMN-dependent dehydrogenase